MDIRKWLGSPAAYALLILILLGCVGAFLRLAYLPLSPEGDYRTYLQTAQYIKGDISADAFSGVSYRILKPLPPLLIAALEPVFGYENATLVQAVFFYFALLIAMFLLANEFFDDVFLASIATIFCILSYPVLKYGLDLLTETGALFFYVISLWLSLKFLKAPSLSLFFWNVCAVIVGFLWKEYSIVAAIVFGLAILFHSSLSSKEKVQYVAMYAALFLAVNIPWQVFVGLKYHYSYISWYHQGGSVGFASQFTLKNLIKSTAGLLGLAWVAVIFAGKEAGKLNESSRRFMAVAVPPPFIAFGWGYIESRLLYVLAPAFILLAVLGMRSWNRYVQVGFVALTVLFNLVWLFLSFSVKL